MWICIDVIKTLILFPGFAATPELLSVKDVEELEMEAADVRRSLMRYRT